MHEKGGTRICSENSHTAYITVISNGLNLGFFDLSILSSFMTFSCAVCNYSFNLYGLLISGFLFYKVSVLYLCEKLLLFLTLLVISFFLKYWLFSFLGFKRNYRCRWSVPPILHIMGCNVKFWLDSPPLHTPCHLGFLFCNFSFSFVFMSLL